MKEKDTKNIQTNKKMEYIYGITLLIAMGTPLFFIKDYNTKTIILLGLLEIVIFIVHAIIIVFKDILLLNIIDKKFQEEYNVIMQNRDSSKPEEFYQQLIQMNRSPRTKLGKNAYYLSLSTAFYGIKDFEKAMKLLDEIKTYDNELTTVIEKQREEILRIKQENIEGDSI